MPINKFKEENDKLKAEAASAWKEIKRLEIEIQRLQSKITAAMRVLGGEA